MSNIRILKYPIHGEGWMNKIVCHKRRILDIQLQGDTIVCWIETDENLPEVGVEIVGYGTGWGIYEDYNLSYIKTVQDAQGYVWHFYEVLNKE